MKLSFELVTGTFDIALAIVLFAFLVTKYEYLPTNLMIVASLGTYLVWSIGIENLNAHSRKSLKQPEAVLEQGGDGDR
jgi:hypothetical protein